MARACCRWVALAAAALLASVPASAQTRAPKDCDNGGKVTLAKGSSSREVVLYDASCNSNTYRADSKGKLFLSGLKIQVLKGVAAVTELNLALNALSAVPNLPEAGSMTKLTLTSNLFTSFKDVVLPPNLKTLDLSWNAITSFADMSLPGTLTDLYVGGNKFTKLDGAFPPTLKLLYVHDLPLTASLADATIPSSVVLLSLVNSKLTTLDSSKLPENLTSLDISKNSLTSLPATLPDSMITLIGSGNKIAELVNITFPSTMTTLNLSGNPITKVVGVSFPLSLTTLDLGATPITQFEISRSDYSTLQNLKAFVASIKSPSSCANGADKVTLAGNSICVLSNEAFAALYKSGSSSDSEDSGSSSATAPTPTGKSSSLSVVLIVVICVAAVLALALAVVGVRSYRAKQTKKQDFGDAAFFATHTQVNFLGDKTNGGGSGNVYSNNPNGTMVNDNSGYNFNTMFNGGKTMMMGGAGADSSLVKYRIPSGDIKIGKAIAKGGFGVVHVANYNGDTVVVKKILPDKASDDRSLAAFLDEIKLCSTLRHEKIVSFVGVTWNTLSDMAVVLEFMPNGDLEQLLRRQLEDKTEDFDWYQNSATLPYNASDRPSAMVAHYEMRTLLKLHTAFEL
ncbi:hypothetical protein PybrP1_005517 [[Pythium] brassicae (nom. inval.)]|nr:hypothetical protein PybrP1_005517 [[Pythium] brassicae (nom. inval.)]